jgi:hypothetical protein
MAEDPKVYEADWVIEHFILWKIGVNGSLSTLRTNDAGRWMYTSVGPEGPRADPPIPRFRQMQRFSLGSAMGIAKRMRQEWGYTYRLRNVETGDIIMGDVL